MHTGWNQNHGNETWTISKWDGSGITVVKFGQYADAMTEEPRQRNLDNIQMRWKWNPRTETWTIYKWDESGISVVKLWQYANRMTAESRQWKLDNMQTGWQQNQGSENWTICKRDDSRIKAAEIKFMSRMTDNTRSDYRRNVDKMKELNTKQMTVFSQQYRPNCQKPCSLNTLVSKFVQYSSFSNKRR
jgi:hypothetical protein